MQKTTLVAVAVATASSLLAQQADHPIDRTPVSIDSGYLANPDAVERVLWTHDVPIAAAWAQLHFNTWNLPAGSFLRIASTQRLHWAQRHDGTSLLDYEGWSCHFLGGAVRVELVAAPHSNANRIAIDTAVGLHVDGVQQPETICGPTDDRVLSTDPRACRINSSCSAWLYSEYAVGTAGHCMSSTTGQILHFNVPLSTGGGSTVPAHPNDQYALQNGTLQRLNAGVGQDWSSSAALRNSNTNLFPGQAQGTWYTVVNPPAFGAGQTIRITGYGTGNGTSGSPTWNQVQKTHTGTRANTATANALSYATDTTGGNSGSPVILESSGQVIGVHTHGGCSSTGGANSGTSAARTDWTAARATTLALHTVGGFSTFGAGCGSPSGVPAMAFTGIPEISRSFTVRVTGLNPSGSQFGSFVLGFSTTMSTLGPLPLGLGGLGLQGCTLFVANDVADSASTSAGQAQRTYTIPNAASFVGTDNFFQYFALDPTAPNTVRAVASNAGRVRVGN
ncbi:MAG: trypsin-like serine protease [Planctomycetes bacterium]|nr:trypsin-like serine protease [Planctomycetota bacterium]